MYFPHPQSAYVAPVDSASFPLLATVFIIVGLLFVASFIIYELGRSSRRDSALKVIVTQIGIGGLASIFLGTGTLFALLASGVYL